MQAPLTFHFLLFLLKISLIHNILGCGEKDWLYCLSFAAFSCRDWGTMLRGNVDIRRIPSAWNQLRSGGLGVTEWIVYVRGTMSWIWHAPFPEPASAREWVWAGSRYWMLQMPLGPFSLLLRAPFWDELLHCSVSGGGWTQRWLSQTSLEGQRWVVLAPPCE